MSWSFTLFGTTMNWLDVIILALCLIRGITGSIRGFASEFTHTAGLFFGAFFGILFTSLLLPRLSPLMPQVPQVFIAYLSFLALVLVGYCLSRILGKMLASVLDMFHLGALDTVLGFVWGFLYQAFFLSILVYMFSLQNIFDFTPFFSSSFLMVHMIQPIWGETVSVVSQVL